jgi:hypothetical protein
MHLLAITFFCLTGAAALALINLAAFALIPIGVATGIWLLQQP